MYTANKAMPPLDIVSNIKNKSYSMSHRYYLIGGGGEGGAVQPYLYHT